MLWELTMFCMGGVFLLLFAYWLYSVNPKSEEKYISTQYILWEDKLHRCGTDEVIDGLSLYCRGYKEGYEWGGEQAVMFCKLDREIQVNP